MNNLAFSIPTSSEEEQRQLFTGFRAAGFAGLQLKGGQYLRYLQEPRRFQDDWGSDPGAGSGLIWGGTLDSDAAALRQVLTFAATVGAERVIFCHGLARTGLNPDDLRAFSRQMSEIGKESLQHGVHLSLHHHFEQPVMLREEIAIFFDAIDTGAVGLTIDTAHLVKSGVHDVAGIIREFREHVDNIHLKDYASGGFRTLGEGAIPFGPIFGALHEINYQGWLCADEESGASIAESLRISHDFLLQHTLTAAEALNP